MEVPWRVRPLLRLHACVLAVLKLSALLSQWLLPGSSSGHQCAAPQCLGGTARAGWLLMAVAQLGLPPRPMPCLPHIPTPPGDVNIFLNDHDEPHTAEIEIMVAEPRRWGGTLELVG